MKPPNFSLSQAPCLASLAWTVLHDIRDDLDRQWLAISVDHGRFFSTGHVNRLEADRIAGSPDWNSMTSATIASIPPDFHEVEWFSFGSEICERERRTAAQHKLRSLSDDANFEVLSADRINAVLARAVLGCTVSSAIQPGDPYPIDSDDVEALVYRIVCGDV